MNKLIRPMLCKTAQEPFDKPGWIFEPKWDGERAIAYVGNSDLRFVTRNQKEIAFRYPELAEIKNNLLVKEAVFDGEIVAINQKGISSFALLQERIGLNNAEEIKNMMTSIPVFYIVFDILFLNGKSIENKPLVERKKMLEKSIKSGRYIKIEPFIENNGKDYFRKLKAKGYEGIVAKDFTSAYEEGARSPKWLKIKAIKEEEFVVGGYTEGRGARAGTFGSLLLGAYKKGKLVFVGHSGSGFDEKMLKKTSQKISHLESDTCPFEKIPQTNETAHWLKPTLVAEIQFKSWTADKRLRMPIFVGFREDKKAKEVTL